jgi:hypothetical protein
MCSSTLKVWLNGSGDSIGFADNLQPLRISKNQFEVNEIWQGGSQSGTNSMTRNDETRHLIAGTGNEPAVLNPPIDITRLNSHNIFFS